MAQPRPPGRGWQMLLRIYDPFRSNLDKSWNLNEAHISRLLLSLTKPWPIHVPATSIGLENTLYPILDLFPVLFFTFYGQKPSYLNRKTKDDKKRPDLKKN